MSDGVGHLVGKVALVTGGGRGIGAACARRLAADGASVGITWHRDEGAACATATQVEELGVRAHVVHAALAEPAAAREVVRSVERELGRIDVLVANAATGVFRPLREVKVRHFEMVMSTNATSLVRLCQSARHVSSVIALTSIGSVRAHPGYGSVGVSKAAIEAAVRYLAVELAPKTQVNAISPGVVATRAIAGLFPQAEALLEGAAAATPMGRLVTPEEVAELASFLSSPAAMMLTGQTITLDGGFGVRT